MQVAKNAVVSIDYTLTGPDGKVIDTSTGREPLAYIHGGGNLIPGLERALDGKTAGENVNVSIAPVDAYGERNPAAVHSVPKSAFQGVPEIKVGMQFKSQGEHGEQIVTVTKVEADTVTVDANHPLAGVTLNFDVTIRGIRAATPEELDHGHVHGAGGHHHH